MITTRYSRLADNHSCALIYANDDANYILFPQNLKCFLPHKLRHFDKIHIHIQFHGALRARDLLIFL